MLIEEYRIDEDEIYLNIKSRDEKNNLDEKGFVTESV